MERIGGGVFGEENRSERGESIANDTVGAESEICVSRDGISMGRFGKETCSFFRMRKSLDDRLNMVFVNPTIGADLLNKRQGISGRLCNLKQPQDQADRPASPFIYIRRDAARN
jgi:hypothetical protein